MIIGAITLLRILFYSIAGGQKTRAPFFSLLASALGKREPCLTLLAAGRPRGLSLSLSGGDAGCSDGPGGRG